MYSVDLRKERGDILYAPRVFLRFHCLWVKGNTDLEFLRHCDVKQIRVFDNFQCVDEN